MPQRRKRTVTPEIGEPQLIELIQAHVAAQDAARNLQQFEVLGMVDSLQCPQGVIRFAQHDRPGLGKDAAGALLWLSEFPNLPEIHEGSNDFCQACLATCSDCKGEGKVPCVYTGCGGEGKVKAGEQPCAGCVAKFPGVQPGTDEFEHMVATRNACKKCGGYGAQPVFKACPCCNGAKMADCNVCRGTGKQPTGFAGGAVAVKLVEGRAVNICPECRGTMRAGMWRKQELPKFIMGRLGQYYALGPVVALDVVPPRDGSERFANRFSDRFAQSEGQPAKPPGMVRLHVPPDETGTPLMVLVQVNSALAGQAWFFGGAKFE